MLIITEYEYITLAVCLLMLMTKKMVKYIAVHQNTAHTLWIDKLTANILVLRKK